MPRPIQATIDISALRHNLSQIKAVAPDALVWGVVKADAYGHGIERIFEGLKAADGLALLDLAEAERVRKLGWRGPILLLEGVFETRDLELCSRLNLWHVVHSESQIDMLAVHKTHQPHRVFLKMNTGMNRLGFEVDEIETLAKQLSHSFTFYRNKAELSNAFSIKHLRKTFLTKLHLQTGLTDAMGYQKTSGVILKNYIDKKAVVKEANKRGFSYFGG